MPNLESNEQNPKTVKKLKVLYVRVSSVEQKTDRQRLNAKDYDIILEDKVSGTISFFERPKGCEIKRLMDKDLIASISVWSIDRFGRNLLDILQTLKYTSERGVQVNFISQGLKTLNDDGKENPIAKMVLSVLGVIGEMTRFQIREAQAEGIKLAKARGVYNGRKKNTKETTFDFLKKSRNIKAAQYLKAGYTGSNISKILSMSPTTISKIKRLNNEISVK